MATSLVPVRFSFPFVHLSLAHPLAHLSLSLIVSSLVLFTVMGNRFRKTGKVMPPGVVTVIAAGAGIFNAMKYREWS